MKIQTISLLLLTCFSAIFCSASDEHYIADNAETNITFWTESGAVERWATVANPWSVAIDPYRSQIYWSDLETGSIYRRAMDGSGTNTTVYSRTNAVPRGLVIEGDKLYFVDSDDSYLHSVDINTLVNIAMAPGLVRPNDMTIDHNTKILYITDSGYDAVYTYNLTNNNIGIVAYGSAVDGAWGIAVHPEENAVFISDFHTNGIYRADMDGANLTLIVTNQLTPRGLCVNRHNRRLYWVEAESNHLWSCTLTGLDQRIEQAYAFYSARDLLTLEADDRDDDFLDDAWEEQFFTNLNSSLADDNDNDQVDNFTELAFGSSPNNPAEQPAGTMISFGPDGPILDYAFNTLPWLSYEIMQSEDLTNWTPVVAYDEDSSIPLGSNMVMRSISMNSATNNLGEKHFFRVDARY